MISEICPGRVYDRIELNVDFCKHVSRVDELWVVGLWGCVLGKGTFILSAL